MCSRPQTIYIGSENYSGKRVVRYEDGKEAEIFTLVIKGTMEEGWYENSTAGKNYIEITEEELDDILLGKESENIEQEGKEVGQIFRF